MEPKFKQGDRVDRIEDREVTGATVLSIDAASLESVSEPPLYEIAYDEGGGGWWPEDALEAQPPAPEPEPKQ